MGPKDLAILVGALAVSVVVLAVVLGFLRMFGAL